MELGLIDVKVPEGVVVENVHRATAHILSYKMNDLERAGILDSEGLYEQ